MKYIFSTLLVAILFIGSGLNESKAQNLQFNSAVFYEYGPGNGNNDNFPNPVFTGQLIVQSGKVLKITSGGSNGVNLVSPAAILINDKLAFYTAGHGEIWLPEGTYEIKVCDYPAQSQAFKGFLSGVLYDIVP
jgi:hypothetical protein